MKEYIIEKVLNSSVVLAQNRNNEVILLGKGIGYGKKRGEIVTENQISQVFRSESATELGQMLTDVDPKVVDVSTRIISFAPAYGGSAGAPGSIFCAVGVIFTSSL